jgi:capsular exopolysaccharide synthesis family protein
MTLAQADDSFDPVEPDEALDAREYLRVLWHDKWRIVGLGLLLAIVLGIVGVTLVNPRFRTDVTVAMDPVALAQLLDTTGEPRDLQADLNNELAVADDPELRASVSEQLGFTFDPAVRIHEGSSSSLDFEASADTAAHAQQGLDAMVAAFLQRRIELGAALVDDEIGPIQDQISELQAGRDEASAPLDSVIAQLNDNPSPSYRAQLLEQQLNLENQLGSTLDEFDRQISQAQSTIQRLQNVQESIQGGDNAAVGAAVTTQTTPGGSRLALIGFVLGLLLGVLISVGRRVMDKSIRSKAALEYATSHRVLGLIPRVVDWDEDEVRNVALEHPTSPPAEAYRTLRTSLHFLTVDQSVHHILFTSATAGEGKSTTVANLAVTLARTGMRVLMVDADLRKPRLHQFFGLSGDAGFSTALLGEPVAGLVQPVEGLESLSLLAAGPPLPESSEHLESARATELLTELDGLADLILLDAPPCLPVTDALVLARYADAVILVASAGRTKPKEAQRAAELLDQLRAPLVGSVLNAISREMGDGYAFEYGYELDEPRRPAASVATGATDASESTEPTAPEDGSDEPADDGAPVT